MSKANNYRKATGGPNATFFQAVFNIFCLFMLIAWPILMIYCFRWLELQMDFLKMRYQRDAPPTVYNIPPQKDKITRKPYIPQGDVTMKTSSRTEINCTSWVAESNWTLIETMAWTSAKKLKDGTDKTASFDYLFLLRCPFELETAKKICGRKGMKLLSIESEIERNELIYHMGEYEIAKEWDEGLKSSPALLSFSGRYIWTDYITKDAINSFPASQPTSLSSIQNPLSPPVLSSLTSHYCKGNEWRANLGNDAKTWDEISVNINDRKLPVVFDFNKENSNAEIGCAKFVWPELPPDTRDIPGQNKNKRRFPQYYTVCRSL